MVIAVEWDVDLSTTIYANEQIMMFLVVFQ